MPFRPFFRPLEESEIRLFVLDPDGENGAIRGHIIYARCGTCKYEALSYVWGQIRETSTIYIDGNQVSVTKGLESALRNLRARHEPRVLWIDYICIDQTNIAERNCQVPLMALIYEFATKVNIWLGEATPDSKTGMLILNYFAHETAPHDQPPWAALPPSLVREGLLDVMNRQWFQRMWVVQEATVSKTATMICGTDHFTWESTDCVSVRRFMRMIKYAEISPQWQQAGLDIINMRPLLELLDLQLGWQLDGVCGSSNRSAPDLLDIAHSMRHRLSTDPKDKIFALAGLVEHMIGGEDLRPDYCMTVEAAYDHLRSITHF
jgi:Heterokaryon incompatibility protein (HET)